MEQHPPASGPHYPVWARYEAYAQAVPRGYWVHNLEHGGVILLYRPDAAPAEIERLQDAYAALPPDPGCGYPRALLTPDPLLDTPFAVVAAGRVLDGDCVDTEAVLAWFAEHVAQGPENVCSHGSYPG